MYIQCGTGWTSMRNRLVYVSILIDCETHILINAMRFTKYTLVLSSQVHVLLPVAFGRLESSLGSSSGIVRDWFSPRFPRMVYRLVWDRLVRDGLVIGIVGLYVDHKTYTARRTEYVFFWYMGVWCVCLDFVHTVSCHLDLTIIWSQLSVSLAERPYVAV